MTTLIDDDNVSFLFFLLDLDMSMRVCVCVSDYIYLPSNQVLVKPCTRREIPSCLGRWKG